MSDIKNLKELLAGLKLLAVEGKKIAKDGIGIEDIAAVVDLAKNFDVLAAAVKDINLVEDEIKDLDQAEILELVAELFALVKAVKEA